MSDPRDILAPSDLHEGRPLRREDLLDDPIHQFRGWLADAERVGVPLPHAMALATADGAGRPSVRHVLLRGLDDGFVFHTNRESHKGADLTANPRAAIVFLWKELDRQVTAEGDVSLTSDEEDDAYFAGRPRDAQIGAWASPQSRPIADRAVLDAVICDAEARFAGADVSRPPHWGGYRLTPTTVEFWQGRRHRLHDRFRYALDGGSWRIERLAP
jgi:pyridoxamine 5'-phosphate oxidase